MTRRRVRSLAMLGRVLTVALLLSPSIASAQFNFGVGAGGRRGGVRVGVQAGQQCGPQGCPTPSYASPAAPIEYAPAEASPDSAEVTHWITTVRIRRALPGSVEEVGSGTIVYSEGGTGYAMTCAHLFKDGGTRNVSVDVYGTKGEAGALVRGMTVRGRLVQADYRRDVAVVRFDAARKLPRRNLVPKGWQPSPGERFTASGFPSTTYRMIRTAYLRPVGDASYPALECSGQPGEGQSGGPLMTADGKLAGICNARDPRNNTGLYAPVATSGYSLLDRCELTSLITSPAAPPSAVVDDREPTPKSNVGSGDLISEFGPASAPAAPPPVLAMNPPKRTPPSRPTPRPEPVTPEPAAPAVTAESNDLILDFPAAASTVAVGPVESSAPPMVELEQSGGQPHRITQAEFDRLVAEGIAKHQREHPPTVAAGVASDAKVVERAVQWDWTHYGGLISILVLLVVAGVLIYRKVIGQKLQAAAHTIQSVVAPTADDSAQRLFLKMTKQAEEEAEAEAMAAKYKSFKEQFKAPKA